MNNMFCIVCGSQKLKLVKHSVRDYDDVDVYQCQCCGHRFLHPLPDENRLQAYYDQDTQTKAVYNSKSINLRKIMANSRYDTARRVELLHKETSNNKQPLVLEIGCGYGFFIRETERLELLE
jgi:SAM-dependent methyltransferase